MRAMSVEPTQVTQISVNQGTLYELFEAGCRAHGKQIAVECGTKTWTYEALHRRVIQIAKALRVAGLVPGQTVAISLRRSADLLAAMLAVMRTGGIVVPIDSG